LIGRIWFQHISPEYPDISSESLEVVEIPEKYPETPKVIDKIVLSVVIF
jgi:hypothetical protein